MPIYDFECSRCGMRREEIQKHDDPPPYDTDEMCPATLPLTTLIDDTPSIVWIGLPEPCDFHKMPTTFTQRWPHGTESNEGRGGWEKKPGGVMVRRTAGKEKTKYGEGA